MANKIELQRALNKAAAMEDSEKAALMRDMMFMSGIVGLSESLFQHYGDANTKDDHALFVELRSALSEVSHESTDKELRVALIASIICKLFVYCYRNEINIAPELLRLNHIAVTEFHKKAQEANDNSIAKKNIILSKASKTEKEDLLFKSAKSSSDVEK